MTYTAEIVCDSCKQVIASVGPYDKPADMVMVVAEQTALSRGAQINVASVTCAECLAKQKDFEETINHKTTCISQH